MPEKLVLFSPPYLLFLITAALICLPGSISQRGPAYLGFLSDATDFPPEDYYDYIIVGGGTAGCPLAATLSEKFRVLVLERGGIPYGDPNLMSPDGFLTTLMEVDDFDSPAQAFTSEDGVHNARGRVLGGSSAINAGFYSRADHDFYRRSGINWDLKMVNQSYNWVENAIVFRPDLKNWQSAVRNALLEAGLNPYHGFSLDHVVGTKIGGSTFDSSNTRHSSADLLNYANPLNIKVVLHATVERILLTSSSSPANSARKLSASGVIFRDQMGLYHHAMLRDNGEVLLCAGAIGSPQLLLLSGIGARPYLASWGIPIAHHSPYVGRFMYDNPRNGISILPRVPLDHSLIQVVGITSSGFYLEAASNIVPFTSPARPVFVTVATLMEKIVGPLSSGSLRLASTDVRVNPIVRFNYFRNPIDLELCVNGTRKIADVLRSRSMGGFRFRQWFSRARDFRYVGPALPRDETDDEQMREFCRRTVSTIWHYHGGCLVGKVVDRDLKVIGIDALRVVDGSTFTVSPGTNPQATLLMLGRFFGMKLLRERARQ
ncbi:(R)-mandelonitrile lyase-like [Striga hermonthica]|uniref:(R)-mandelonitrile lyase-like n=1 Tax=Striga hermonthica TaxID=68872 RepID=A0A9N7MK72_STRHE|nr:(R)-mandelonitrile lyase-like [Striga hermonthica]